MAQKSQKSAIEHATEPLYVAFHPDSEVVRDIDSVAHDAGYLPAPAGATSRLALRYALIDGVVVDRYPGKADDEVLTALSTAIGDASAVAAPAANHPISKLAFMERFTDAELAAIYTAAKSSVQIEVWMDKLKLAADVDLADARMATGVQALEAAGLLDPGRAAAILQQATP